MRTLHFTLVLIEILAIGCGKEWTPLPPRQVTLILDKSNEHLQRTVVEDTPEILKAFGLDEDMWAAVDFRLVNITGVAYNRSQELHLSGEDPDEVNFIVRKHRVKAFRERVAELIRLQVTEVHNEDASLVYLPMALELERMSQCSDEQEVIIYSDLVEHLGEGKWSLYDDQLLDSLRRNPDAFVRYFEQERALPNLKGIRCTVVNIPHNTVNSERVSTVYAFYERMLEAKGATVNVSGNYHYDAR